MKCTVLTLGPEQRFADLLCSGPEPVAGQCRHPPCGADPAGRRLSILFRPRGGARRAGLSGGRLQRLCAALYRRQGLPAGQSPGRCPGRAFPPAGPCGGAAHRPRTRSAAVGFSAGGHLAAALGTQSPIRPDAMVLGYAVTLGATWAPVGPPAGTGPGRSGRRRHAARLPLCHPGRQPCSGQKQLGLCRRAGGP